MHPWQSRRPPYRTSTGTACTLNYCSNECIGSRVALDVIECLIKIKVSVSDNKLSSEHGLWTCYFFLYSKFWSCFVLNLNHVTQKLGYLALWSVLVTQEDSDSNAGLKFIPEASTNQTQFQPINPRSKIKTWLRPLPFH